MNKRERMWRGEGKERAGERTGTTRQSDAQSFGVRGVTHTTEPSVEATCLIMGNVCIWGRLWLAQPAWAGKMAHLQLLLHYVSKLCTPGIASSPESRRQATSWLAGLECLGKAFVYVSSSRDKKGVKFSSG